MEVSSLIRNGTGISAFYYYGSSGKRLFGTIFLSRHYSRYTDSIFSRYCTQTFRLQNFGTAAGIYNG